MLLYFVECPTNAQRILSMCPVDFGNSVGPRLKGLISMFFIAFGKLLLDYMVKLLVFLVKETCAQTEF